MTRVSTILVFSNGNIGAFDARHESIPELQTRSIFDLIADQCKTMGYEYDGCLVRMQGYDRVLVSYPEREEGE